MWYSKAQSTIESSTFGAEFVAAKIAVELVEGIQYKLWMFGIPIDGPVNTFVDNNLLCWMLPSQFLHWNENLTL